MALPRFRFTLRDPGEIGRALSTDQIPIFVGTAQAGDLNMVQTFGRLEDVEAEFTSGVLVDMAEHAFALGHQTVRLARVTSAVAGTVGAVTQVGTGGALSVTGTSYLDLAIEVEITATGAPSGGVAKMRYSLDAWDIENITQTWSPEIVIPADGNYPIPGTGLTLDWVGATSVTSGDTYTLATTAPHYSSTEVAAMTVPLQTALAGDFTYVVYTGDHPTDATAAGTLADAIEAQLSTLFAAFRFAGGLAGAGKDAAADVLTAFGTRASNTPFLSIGYGGFYAVKSRPLAGRGFVRLREHDVAGAAIALMAISTDPARTANHALDRIVGLDYDARSQGSALHDARIAVGRTFAAPAEQGVFIARQRLLSAAGSDYTTWQLAAVMITALRVGYAVVFKYLNEGLRSVVVSGNTVIDPSDAVDVEKDGDRALAAALLTPSNARGTPGHASAASLRVSRTAILPTVEVTVRVRPLGYADDIAMTFMLAAEV